MQRDRATGRAVRYRAAAVAVVAAGLLWLPFPPQALAGTVTSSVQRGFGEDGPWQTQRIVYRADRASRDELELTLTPAAASVHDGRVLRPGAGCQPTGPDAARCPLIARDSDVRAEEATIELRAVTADGDDRVRAAASADGFDAAYVRVSVDGGRGRDELSVDAANGRGGVELTGGDGDDVLRGGPGADSLDGGAGDDLLRAAGGDDMLVLGRGRDRLDGGPGIDWLNARALRTPVLIDLTRGTGRGPRVGRDRLRRIEDVEGGRGADTLIGDAGRNALVGGDADRLEGRGGDDVLWGTPSVAVGGAGDDVLPWPVARRLDCGPGQDAIPPPDGPSVLHGVPSSCEWYGDVPPSVWIARRLRLDGDALVAPVWNRAAAAIRFRRFALSRASSPALTVVKDGYGVVGAHAHRDLRMPLTQAGRRYFARGASSVFLTAEADAEGVLWESAFEVVR